MSSDKEVKYKKDKDTTVTFRTNKTVKKEFVETVGNLTDSLNAHMISTIKKGKK